MTPVFRDRWLLVVDKPAGLATQPAPGADDLYSQLKRAEAYVGMHHRLDQAASGLVLVTLDPAVNGAIAAGFREHLIERVYAAVLVGDAADGTWDRLIDGRPARTDVRVVGHGQGLSAAVLRLATGRTHQIRIHAALAGRPIAGDRKYGGEAGRRWPRLALHAWQLGLVHPVGGERLKLTAPLPADLADLWIAAGGSMLEAGPD